MNKIYIPVVAIFCAVLFLSNRNGALPENTGAPSEQTCGRSGCHNVAANVGDATMSIEFSGADQQYLADSIYQVTVKISNQQSVRNGFQIVALNGTNQNVGTWILDDITKMKIISGIGLPNRKYVTHTSAGAEQTEWTMGWKGPSSDMGTVTFYASVNATNRNGSSTGDQVYTSSLPTEFAESTVAAKEFFGAAIKVYPIPANEGVWIELPVEGREYNYTLFAAGGNIVRESKSIQGGKQYLEMHDLVSGIYFLKMEAADGQSFFRKVVVQ